MDTNAGRFIDIEKSEEQIEAWMQTIAVGETIKIKGEECEVVSISEREITLKLKSLEDRQREEAESLRRLLNSRGDDLERRLARDGAGFIGGAPGRKR